MAGNERFRQLIVFCGPALVIGMVLRVALTWSMPWGYVQYDSAEYLETPFRLLKSGSFFVDGKRGLLVPILFTLPFLLHLPALIFIPLGQHLLGLAATVMSGALTRLWFRWWRWFIVPVTLYVAANPSMLWYEQTIMGESEYLCALIFLALAGTLWAREPSRRNFGWLMGALICTAGARPEGKLFFAFGLLLAAMVLWKQWRALAHSAGIMLAVAGVWSLIVRQSTAPQLLYASLIQLAPDHSRFLPGIEVYINPLRDKVRKDSGGDPQQLVQISKEIRNDLDPYIWPRLAKVKDYTRVSSSMINELCLDAILAHPLEALGIPVQKFRVACDSWSAYQWKDHDLQHNQVAAYQAGKDGIMFVFLAKGLTGHAMDTAGEADFVRTHYPAERVAWFDKFQEGWSNAMIGLRTADAPSRHERWVHDFAGGVPGGLAVMPGVPLFYPLALLGMLLAMAWPDPSRRAHLAWAPVMLGIWYAATLVGVTNARYRFAYEPFCFIYLCLLADRVARIFAREGRETLT